MPIENPSVSELRFLEPSALHFSREGARLRLRQEGEADPHDVALLLLFPLSEPERWVAVIDKDDKEIGIIEDTHKLSRENLAHVRDELRRRYIVPRIRRILACKRRFDIDEWTVDTDRGQMKFLTRNLREQIKEHDADRMTLMDVEGNRFDIDSVAALDPDSRRRLLEHL